MSSLLNCALCLFLCLALSACVGSPCDNTVLSESVSPDKRYIATVFSRDCGATAPFAKAVFIRAAGSKFEANNIEDSVFTIRGDHAVSLDWLGSNQLVIEHPVVADDIFKELKTWKDLRIESRPPF